MMINQFLLLCPSLFDRLGQMIKTDRDGKTARCDGTKYRQTETEESWPSKQQNSLWLYFFSLMLYRPPEEDPVLTEDITEPLVVLESGNC